MLVEVDLDPRIVDVLRDRAAAWRVPFDVVVNDALSGLRGGRNLRAQPLLRDSVRERVEAGACDADIAAALHTTVAHVGRVRRGLGLPANRRFRGVR